MKRYFLFMVILPTLTCLHSIAQTNTFPSSGNAGIGTTSPQVPLHLSQNSTDGQAIRLENSSAGGTYKFIQFMQLGSNGFGYSDWPNAGLLEGAANGGLVFSAYAGDLKFSTSDSRITRMTIKNSTGNVGIGTTTPQATLSLGAAAGKRMLVYDGGDASVQAGFGIDMSGSGRELSLFHSTSNGSDGDISFGRRLESTGAYTELMRIRGDGNVGIGTASPQAKLAVNGDLYAKKVKVTQTGWPDYVFHKTYKLRPLSEVEQYIKKYQHLPEVPSAAKIEKDGVDLGDNQATLLKKIEELTLYIIDLNKEVNALKKEIRQKQISNR